MLSTMFTYIYTGKDNLFWLSFVLKYLNRTSTSVRPHRHVTIVSKIILKLSHNRFSLRALLEPKTSSLSALSCTDSFGMEIITRLWMSFDISIKIFHWLLSFSWNSMACDLLFLSIASTSSFSLMYCSCTIRDESPSDPDPLRVALQGLLQMHGSYRCHVDRSELTKNYLLISLVKAEMFHSGVK